MSSSALGSVLMLIELIGPPGVGKTTACRLAFQRSRSRRVAICLVGEFQRLSGPARRLARNSFAVNAAAQRLGLSELRFGSRFASFRKTAYLQGLGDVAVAAQRSHRALLAHELLMHAIWGALWQQPLEMRRRWSELHLAPLIAQTYDPKRVAFIWIHPSQEDWKRCILSRGTGLRTDIGRSTPSEHLGLLLQDQTYQDFLVPTLERCGHSLTRVSSSADAVHAILQLAECQSD
jgi:hypothetical protein